MSLTPGAPGYSHPPGAGAGVHALDLLGAINQFLDQLSETDLIATKIMKTSFEKDFGKIPIPAMVTRPGNMDKAVVSWLKSPDGRRVLNHMVQQKATELKQKRIPLDRALNSSNVRMVLTLEEKRRETAQQAGAREKEAAKAAYCALCEGPCDGCETCLKN